MKLIICGNGFDLHHKMETSYSCYRHFLFFNYLDIYKQYNDCLYITTNGDRWADIEKSLAINYRKLLDDVMSGKNNMCCVTNFIDKFTGSCYAKWLEAVWCNTKNQLKISKDDSLAITKEDLFINFNYTETLQLFYGIPDNQVLHIHGKLNQADSGCNPSVRKEIQFGATDISCSEVEEYIKTKYKIENLYGVNGEHVFSRLIDFVRESTKCIESNYEKLELFLSNKNIDEIVIMGHSLNGADKSYYEQVIAKKFKDKKWTFMCHYNQAEIEEFIKEFNLSNTKIICW